MPVHLVVAEVEGEHRELVALEGPQRESVYGAHQFLVGVAG